MARVHPSQRFESNVNKPQQPLIELVVSEWPTEVSNGNNMSALQVLDYYLCARVRWF